jgi:hypothetical protein
MDAVDSVDRMHADRREGSRPRDPFSTKPCAYCIRGWKDTFRWRRVLAARGDARPPNPLSTQDQFRDLQSVKGSSFQELVAASPEC